MDTEAGANLCVSELHLCGYAHKIGLHLMTIH